MSDKFINVIILVFSFPMYVNSMTISFKDSITYKSESEYIQLTNNFIIQSTVRILSNDSLIKPQKIYPIEGKVFLEGIPKNTLLVIEYEFLNKNIPLIIGPKWKQFPILDTLFPMKEIYKDTSKSTSSYTNQTIYSSGSFFRSLSISPFAASDLQGGIQLQLNGIILENIKVSGILTDQNFPLQDEGNTKELKDFDKVFLNVQHPQIELDAGDIDYIHSDANYTINRKLEGLKNVFQFRGWSGSSVYASSKGEFHFIEFKGRDGDQGPYQLVGKDGKRDIAILSGTEKVWLNGNRLERGQNYDYTIDYSSSEIYFTPRRLIDFDTDIFVEYQYSDFNYQKGFRGITLENKIGNSGHFSVGLFDEFDQYNQIDLENEKLKIFLDSDNSSVTQSTALLDSTGDYVLVDSIFVYDPLKDYDDFSRYQVRFILDPSGNYIRDIGDDNKMFYRYIGDLPKVLTKELYSPFRTILSPTAQQFGKANLSISLNEVFHVEGQISGSRFNQNTIGSKRFTNALSHLIKISSDTIDIDYLKFYLVYKNQRRGRQYSPLGREQEIMQTRLWNLDQILLRNSDAHYFQSDFIIEKLGISSIEYALLNYENSFSERYRFTQNFFNKNFNNSLIDILYIDNPLKTFHRALFNLERDGPIISPNILLATEQSNYDHRFQKAGIGLKFNVNDSFISSGVEKRIDQQNLINNNWSTISNDIVGYVDFSRNSKNGLKKDLTYKKRIKSSEINFNYSLLDLTLSWRNKRSPITCYFDFKKEETLTQNRTLIYEYIGPGLGNYRYDIDLNTYIFDLNGDHISYSINIGNREPKTIFLGSQRFTIDLPKNDFFPSLYISSHNNQEFRGKNFAFHKIGESNISDASISKSLFFTRNEITLLNSRLAKIWFHFKKDLEGYDPRGNNIYVEKEVGIENILKVDEKNAIKNNIDYHDFFIDSKTYPNRKRELYGAWNNFSWQKKLKSNIDLDLGIVLGFDRGIVNENIFNAKGRGMKSKLIFYFKQNGRLQTEVTFVNVEEDGKLSTLPPEALKGYTFGKSLNTNTSVQFLLNKSLSLNLNLNTINNIRYKNAITMQGEFRAYF